MKAKRKIFVLLGATGDLAKRKLFRALQVLFENDNSDLIVLGASADQYNDEEFRNQIVIPSLKDTSVNEKFISQIYYNKLDFTNTENYKYLISRIDELSNSNTEIIFYLAIPPQLFTNVLENLNSHRINKKNNRNIKIVFEKPFGTDLKSATILNNSIIEVFDEKQIYRIDHYLGKDAVQNFLVFRFANSIFEPLWNHKYIDNIQITGFETLGVEQRAGYYDHAGALRDMVENHLFQMLSLIAMEPPSKLDADSIRDEKVKIFDSIEEVENWKEHSVFGQYSSNTINNEYIKGYKEEEGVAKNSRTETYVALKILIDNWRWKGVPFYLRTGKRMKKSGTTIVIEFKDTPNILYNKKGNLEPNRLIIKVQPNSNILMEFNIKSPNKNFLINSILTEFDKQKFCDLNTPEAYVILFEEIFKGDQTLFTRWDGVEKSWRIVDKLINCKSECPVIFPYDALSWGPVQADELLEKDNHKWYHFDE